MSVMTIVMSIGSIAAPLSAAARAAGAASIFFTIIDAPQPKTSGVTAPEVSAQEDIVLENVNFAYPIRADVKVLDDLSLRFPAGKLTAIVGASGSGKSTIVGLVERWYELDGNWTDNITVSLPCYTVYECIADIDLRPSSSVTGLSPQVGEISTKSTSSGGGPKLVWCNKSLSCSMTRFSRMSNMVSLGQNGKMRLRKRKRNS
jgi:energy-coupling factor transporter ATP-binding protein EcfA2